MVIPTSLRRVAFLEFQALDREGKPQANTQFYEVLPALITAFPAFERLNSFAETFAIVRWAKLSGATITPPAVSPATARLMVLSGPDGDLFQFSSQEAPRGWAAICLTQIRSARDTALMTMRSANAPDIALSRVADMSEILEDNVRNQSAIWMLSQITASDQIINIVRQDLEEFQSYDGRLANYTDRNAFLFSFLGKQNSDKILPLKKEFDKSMDDRYRSQGVLDTQGIMDILIAALPDKERRLISQLYSKLKKAESDEYNADTDDEAETYHTKVLEITSELGKSLPALDQTQIEKERAREQADVARRTNEMSKAKEAYQHALDAAEPNWFDPSWVAITAFLQFGQSVQLRFRQ
jgi:hypothetical protein